MSSGINVLMYHQIGEFEPMAAHRSTYCHVHRFAAQMAWLHRFGYTALRIDDVLACVRGERRVPPSRLAVVGTSRASSVSIDRRVRRAGFGCR